MNARLEELRTRFQENPRRYFAPFANELRKSGDAAQAIAICRTHLGSQPGHVSGHIVLGQALHEAGEPAEARQAFTAALELDPENLIALRTMGEIAYSNGELDDARHWYERLLDADPRNTEVVQLLADLAAVPRPVVRSPVEGVSPPVITMQSPDLALPLPNTPPMPAAAAAEFMPPGPVEPQAVEPAFTTSSPTPAPDVDTGLVVEPVDLFPSSESAVAPEPLVLTNPVESIAAEGSVGELLEIEDMESFLSSAAAEATFSAEEPAVYESDPAAAVSDVAFELEEPAANASEAPVEAPAQAFDALDAIEMEQPEVGEPVAEHPEAGATGAPTETAPAAELPDEWSLPASMDAFEAAQPPVVALPIEPSAAAFESVEVTPAAEASGEDAPHATFAEHGFDGTAHDVERVSWMTPGAAEYSDPEAAPDWFAEPAPEGRSEVDAFEPVASEPEPAPSGTSDDDWFAGAETPVAPDDPAADDWFDEPVAPQTVAVHEPEDLYLAPDLAIAATQSFDQPADAADADQPEPVAAEVEVAEPVVVQEEVVEPVAAYAEFAEPVAAVDVVEPVERVERAEPVVASAELPPVEATQTVEVAAAGSDPATSVEIEAGPLLPLREEFPQAPVGRTPRYTPVVGVVGVEPPKPAPFVTETLAELYVTQGFRDEAVAIYRQLVDRDPSDESLRQRLAELERGGVGAVVPTPEANPATRSQGQSVRSFFGSFARRTPSAAAVDARLTRKAATPANSPAVGGSGQPESSFVAAASALANLFPASRPASADEGAASTLAGAFTDGQPTGRPSRAADRELSLDHLFRDVPAGATGGMMLDEFYAPPSDSSGPAARSDEGAGAPDEGEADIRQFTAWLEGLRKK